MWRKINNLFPERRLFSFLSLSLMLFCFVISCTSQEGYRKKIEQKGIPYSEESFLNEVRKGNREHAKMFLLAGMDINAKDRQGCTALLVASENGHLELLKYIMGNGADVNARDKSGFTALMYAAYDGNVEIAKVLIDKGIDINARDRDGWSALQYSILKGRTEMVELLKKSGAGK